MLQRPVNFKQTQVFDWEAEPAPERPSEFPQSTGFSTLTSGYAVPPSERYRRRRNSGAFVTWLLAALVVGAAVAAMVWMAHGLKG